MITRRTPLTGPLLIGASGFGQLWTAHGPKADRLVVVKVLTGGSADSNRQVARFVGPARIRRGRLCELVGERERMFPCLLRQPDGLTRRTPGSAGDHERHATRCGSDLGMVPKSASLSVSSSCTAGHTPAWPSSPRRTPGTSWPEPGPPPWNSSPTTRDRDPRHPRRRRPRRRDRQVPPPRHQGHVEPQEGADTLLSLRCGQRIALPEVPATIADGLGHTSPSPLTWAVNSKLLDAVVTVPTRTASPPWRSPSGT